MDATIIPAKMGTARHHRDVATANCLSHAAIQFYHPHAQKLPMSNSASTTSQQQQTESDRKGSNQTRLTPFHLAIEVRDLAESRAFYGGLFECPEGRSDKTWVDYDFFGHQLVCHVSDTYPASRNAQSNPVDGHAVPIPHFGVVLEMDQWHALAAKLKSANIEFIIEPYTRFEGQPGEQATMFLHDPSGNALEFKSFRDIEGQLFAK